MTEQEKPACKNCIYECRHRCRIHGIALNNDQMEIKSCWSWTRREDDETESNAEDGEDE